MKRAVGSGAGDHGVLTSAVGIWSERETSHGRLSAVCPIRRVHFDILLLLLLEMNSPEGYAMVCYTYSSLLVYVRHCLRFFLVMITISSSLET